MDKKLIKKFKKIKEEFPILKKKINGKNLIYFDNAATTQKPKIVINGIKNYYENYCSNVKRSSHFLSSKSDEIYENSRKNISKFIGCKNDELIFTNGTTQSLNIISNILEKKIKKNDEILISISEHNSNLVLWQEISKKIGAKLIYIPLDKNFKLDFEIFKTLISKKTKILSLGFISNVLGNVNEVEKFFSYLKNKNKESFCVLDMAQSISHKKINLKKIGCDFAGFSGHKFFAFFGCGLLYMKKNIIKKSKPINFGGEMIKEVFKKKSIYMEDFRKFEAGTPNVSGVYSMSLAINFIKKIGYNDIEKYEKYLTEYFLTELEKIKNIKILGCKNNKNRIPIFSIYFENVNSFDVEYYLNNSNIACRVGPHCTNLFHNEYGLKSSIRFSLCFYNTTNEIDLVIIKLKKILKLLN